MLPAPASVTVSVDTWNRFKIDWSPVTGATGYSVQRRRDNGVFETVNAPAADVTNFFDTVENGHLYTYRVQAIGGGTLGLSTDAREAPMLWPVGISLLPTGPDRMEVSWTLPSNPWLPAAGYAPVIERKPVGGTWTFAGRAAVGATAFTDTGLMEGMKYEYRVRFDVGLSGAGLWWPMTTDGSAAWTKLRAPTGLSATLTSWGTVDLAWATTATQAAFTQVERSTDGNAFQLLNTIAAGTLSWSDTTVVNGHVYRYRVRHGNAGSTGDWSNEDRIIFLYPTALSADAAFPDQINLVWSWPSVDPAVLGEAQPRIERRKAGETDWTTIALLEPGVSEYRDQSLDPDTIYNYRIQALYTDGSASPWYPPYGQGREVRTGIAYNVGFTGHALSSTMVRLEWDFPALAGKTVRLQRFDPAGVPQTVLQSATEGSYIDAGLLPGTLYAWQLVILAPSGLSTATSEKLTIKTEAVPTPGNVAAAAAASDRVVITWEYGYAQESGFEIWRKTSGTWTKVGETLRNVLYWTDTALPETGTAQWRVRAVRGDSVYSAFATTIVRRLDAPKLPETFQGSMSLARMNLSWDTPLPNYGTDAVYTLETREGPNEAWVDLQKLAAGNTSVEWFLMHHGIREFRIRADVQGLPLYSAIWRHTGMAPAAPTGLRTSLAGSRQVTLVWDPASESISGLRIYRTDGTRRLVGTVPGNVSTYTDTFVTPGEKPRYAVASWNAYSASADALAGPVTIPAAPRFTDLGSVPWAVSAINRMAGRGVVSGTSATLFSPGAILTRAQAMTMLQQALGLQPEARPSGPVADVPATAWYAGWMYGAWTRGLLVPDAKGNLLPGSPVTRGAMALAVQNACVAAGKTLVWTDETVLDKFLDAETIVPATRGAFAMLVGNGIMSGVSGSMLSPYKPLTRAEAAVILDKLLSLK